MRFLYAFVAFLAAFWRGRSGVGCLSAEIGLCAFRAGDGAGGHAVDVAWPLRQFAAGFLPWNLLRGESLPLCAFGEQLPAGPGWFCRGICGLFCWV